jgi:hypothetical protein
MYPLSDIFICLHCIGYCLEPLFVTAQGFWKLKNGQTVDTRRNAITQQPLLTFSAFGNADLKTIQELCDSRGLDPFIKANAEDIWKRHPSRRGIFK